MDLTLDQLLRILGVAATLLSAALNVYLFLKARSLRKVDALNTRVETVEKDRRDGDARLHKRVDETNEKHLENVRRISVLETNVKALPTHEDISEIDAKLLAIKAELSANTSRTDTTLSLVRDINNFLRAVPR